LEQYAIYNKDTCFYLNANVISVKFTSMIHGDIIENYGL
jgi:hypothetical protein